MRPLATVRERHRQRVFERAAKEQCRVPARRAREKPDLDQSGGGYAVAGCQASIGRRKC
jgi:hypothetical protein